MAFVGAAALLALALGVGSARTQELATTQAKGEFKTIFAESVGNVTMTQRDDGSVAVELEVRGMPPGEHGLHIHQRGVCLPNFDDAGAHHNPGGDEHGLENSAGPHAGDLPALTVKDNGTGTLTTSTDRISITPGPATIFDDDGSALIIHAYPDDQQTDPSGNTGPRIACAVLQPVAPAQPPADLPPQTSATAEFKTTTGETVGSATMTQRDDGTVQIQAQVRGLPAGEHGIHFHQFGICTPTFQAAGAHFNPRANEHGLENPDGPHAGDLPNLIVGDGGSASYDATTGLFTLTPGPATVFDADGTALIIHAYPDDQMTDPSGNSGPRIACAVIQPATPAQP